MAEGLIEIEEAEEVDSEGSSEDNETYGRLSGALGELTQVGSDWTPWKTKRSDETPKPEAVATPEPSRYSASGRFQLCSVHNKQRLASMMEHVPGTEKWRCRPPNECIKAEEREKEKESSRYYLDTGRQNLQKRQWRKVCWECGLGEHERTNCINAIHPVTATLRSEGPGSPVPETFENLCAALWRSSYARLSPSEVTDSLCAVCFRPGSVNCCAPKRQPSGAGVLSCCRCGGTGHNVDTCPVPRTGLYHRPSQSPLPTDGRFGGRASPPPPLSPLTPRGYGDASPGTPPGRHFPHMTNRLTPPAPHVSLPPAKRVQSQAARVPVHMMQSMRHAVSRPPPQHPAKIPVRIPPPTLSRSLGPPQTLHGQRFQPYYHSSRGRGRSHR